MATRRLSLQAAAEAALCEATGATRVVRLCPHCGSSAHGRPRLIGSELAVSLAYAAELAVVAWGPGPLGVDVEHLPGPDDVDLLAWTRTEALAKAAGTGLRDWPDVVLPELATTALDLPEGYVGTLAGIADGWTTVTPPHP